MLLIQSVCGLSVSRKDGQENEYFKTSEYLLSMTIALYFKTRVQLFLLLLTMVRRYEFFSTYYLRPPSQRFSVTLCCKIIIGV